MKPEKSVVDSPTELMRDQPNSSVAPPLAPAPTAAPPRRGHEPMPIQLGLGLTLSFVVGVLGVLVVSGRLLLSQGDSQRAAIAGRIAEQAVALLVAQSEASAEALTSQCIAPAAALGPLRSLRWTDGSGATRLEWREASAPRDERYAPITVSRPLPAPALGTVTLELELEQASSGSPLIWAGAGIALLSLASFLLFFRRLTNGLRPYFAIQRNLDALANGIEKNLAALSLSDSLGHVANSWNQLIDLIADSPSAASGRKRDDPTVTALDRLELRKLRDSMEALPLGVLRVNAEGLVRYANAAVAQLLGRRADSLSDTRIVDALPQESAEALLGAAQRAAVSHSVDQKLGEGEEARVLRMQLLPASDPGETERVVVIQDVTHMQEVERARDHFLYHVTHELRTPLTNIQAYAETLTKPDFEDEETRRECYNVIISETRRLSRLVEDVLSVSQLEVGSARIERSEVDIVRLLRQIVQDNLGAADEKTIDLRLILPPKSPTLIGDKERLASLLNNLIGNAIKYTPRGGGVVVELRVDVSVLRILVSDTGIGIAPEDQPRVFEKFFRSGSEQVLAQPGTGLGLAIAREIARTHGGEIRLQSEVGVGSTFELELPRPNDAEREAPR